MAEEMVKRSPSQEKYERVQFAVRLLVLIVLLAWIFIWIMIPTNTYRQKWLPQLRAKTSSTYFGAQGLLFFFPIRLCISLFVFAFLYFMLINILLWSSIIAGASLLIYTFPVLFMASLGCVYLHIVRQANDSSMER